MNVEYKVSSFEINNKKQKSQHTT